MTLNVCGKTIQRDTVVDFKRFLENQDGKLWGNRPFHSLLLAIGYDTSTVEVDSAVVSKPYKYLSFDIEIPLLGRYQDLLRG